MCTGENNAPYVCSNWGRHTILRSEVLAVGSVDKKRTKKDRKDGKNDAFVHRYSVPSSILDNNDFFENIPEELVLKEKKEEEVEGVVQHEGDDEEEDNREGQAEGPGAAQNKSKKSKKAAKKTSGGGVFGVYRFTEGFAQQVLDACNAQRVAAAAVASAGSLRVDDTRAQKLLNKTNVVV
jgi:hypothetical protein